MEENIKILEEFIDAVGEEYEVVREKQALENLIKGYRKLKLENQALQNTKDTCPNMATSGIRCDAKEKLQELEKENQSYRDYMGEPPCYDNASYIKKSKIIEKIEELLKKLDKPNNDRWVKDDDVYYNQIKVQIRILKELL